MNDMAYLDELTDRYPSLEPVKESIRESYEILKECFSSGHKLLVAGNGGSAADSEHIVGELMKGFVKSRKLDAELKERLKAEDADHGAVLAEALQAGLPAIALNGHPGLSTAFANDVDADMVFAQQVCGYGAAGDVFLGISHFGQCQKRGLCGDCGQSEEDDGHWSCGEGRGPSGKESGCGCDCAGE